MERRTVTIKAGEPSQRGTVLYWMSRDQRVSDNWALLSAQQKAMELKQPLVVVFCLVPGFLGATIRQYGFMLKGLEEVERGLMNKGIPFFLLDGLPGEEIPRFLRKIKASWLFTDFDPLRIKRQWKAEVAREVRIPFSEVDAHNIIPCRVASPKQEWAAYTLRPKIRRLLDRYLVPFPTLLKHPWKWDGRRTDIPWDRIKRNLKVDRSVTEVGWLQPGKGEAHRTLKKFLREGLSKYGERRREPDSNVQSDLSPYLHFGQISAARVALETRGSGHSGQAVDGFLEELVVRRELADNYCFYNPDYDSFKGFPDWSRKSLDLHRSDPRPYLYRYDEFDNAETHDPLWNAAQMEMVNRGKMHGYLRMYWAKKILEWTHSPEEALEIAVRLNDRYELDGRDPNGYTGIAWSIGGVHDRAWAPRPIFGKIRYMGDKGVRTKFDVKGYIDSQHFL